LDQQLADIVAAARHVPPWLRDNYLYPVAESAAACAKPAGQAVQP